MEFESSYTPEKAWAQVLEAIKPEIPLQSFNTWFKSTIGTFLDDRTFRISVPNKFASQWIEGKFKDVVETAITANLGSARQLEFTVNLNANDIIKTPEISSVKTASLKTSVSNNIYTSTELNPRYSFESFVVGDSNRFAHAAALAVSEDPTRTKYNPLYIYGGVGLGKTHLAQAIGRNVGKEFSTLKILYVTSEKFTNDFIDAIARSRTSEFARLYRSVDLLLLDDIQFLAGKEATQEQFFHTFNALYQAGKQIVLTSDRSPREIKGLEERLLSRFQCGLVTDIQAPDLETRIAILNQIVESDGLSIPPDVISYIANNITKNIRELEGSIIRLLAYGSLTGKQIDTMLAYEVLRVAFTTERSITVESIIRSVCDYYQVKPEQLKSRRKTADLVRARQVGMFLCRKHTPKSLKVIGAELGGRDHSTVIHSINIVTDGIELDLALRVDVESIENLLKS
ncbi:MAG: chromosomal replication initiator protein DnaA [candidate division Zixibacteria bacterium]